MLMTTFIGIILGMFGISIMQLILATAMPFIVTEIGGETLYSWVFSSYMLASLLTIPVFSKLADRYGKKLFYLLGMGFFAAGTLYGALAPNMENLIVARVIQGLGAGMMIPVSIALISDMFPPAKRGVMIGAFSFVQLVANLLSPILGSVITKQLGWHWIFYITLMMVLLAILLVTLDKKKTSPTNTSVRWTQIDILGGVLFGIFCVLTVSFSNSVSKLGQLELTGVFLLIGAVATGLILALNEFRHKDPVIKLTFFQTKVLRQSIFSSLIAGSIMYGLVTLLPLCSISLKQNGFKADESQLLMIFMIGTTLGLIITSRFINQLNALFPKIIWGLSLLCAGGLYYAISVRFFVLFNIITGLLGLSLGGIMATLLINSQNAVSSEDRTVLSGLVQLGRYLGAAIGVTILTGILPEVSQIGVAAQFLGAFGLLVGMYILGLVNEMI
jgi:multidrug resistance protein